MEEDSWEIWLSHLGMSAGSSLSFEEAISFNDDDTSNNKNNNIAERSFKRGLEINNEELLELDHDDLMKKRGGGGGRKKGRSSSEHIMSERKRRQEMAERFIALSATIPGLKKIDKASVLQEAINYVKQLQDRITVLEKETNNNKITKSLIIKKSHLINCDERNNIGVISEVVAEVEARGLGKEVLIRIHCEKRKGIMLNLLALLENHHLSVASSSILPFGNSALNIIIIAQMTEEFSLTVNDLVKILKQHLMKHMTCICGPC